MCFALVGRAEGIILKEKKNSADSRTMYASITVGRSLTVAVHDEREYWKLKVSTLTYDGHK